jgi:cation diffusion facilitator family transporter
MDSCCQDKAGELEALWGRQARVLWVVLGINAVMFVVEAVMGVLAGSLALLADSLDMLGDVLVYGFSLYVVGRSVRWRAAAALLKGIVMALFGMMVLGQAVYHIIFPEVPDFRIIGATGIVALAANLVCLALLTRHRKDDLNMKSTWLCSRNDIISNVGVLVAAVAVFALQSPWPDVAVGLMIMAVFMQSAVLVLRQSIKELRQPAIPAAPTVPLQPLTLQLGRCPAGACPAATCRCEAG